MKNAQKIKRQKRIRARIQGTYEMPRLSIYRSNQAISAQIIDDSRGKTLLGMSEKPITTQAKKSDRAKELGKKLAEKALAQKIKKVVFDRGSYAYHGRVKAFAEGAKEAGLQF